MIIQYSENNENRIEWQHRRGGEWKTAELDELIEAYERATEPGDLISRAEAIRMYCKSGCGCEPSECGLTHEQDGTEECGVVRFLKSVPSAEKTGKWIPISEMMPEKFGEVLVTLVPDAGTLWTKVIIAHYSDLMGISKPCFWIGEVGKGSFCNITKQVVAWMPKPKAYNCGARMVD